MPRLIEMGALLARCKQRADKEHDDHIADGEWRSLISEVFGADVYSVVAETGLRYFEYRATLTTTGDPFVSEPPDHLSTIRVDYVDGSGNHFELEELNVLEEGLVEGRRSGDRARAFTLIDDRIYLYPAPPAGQTYEMLYIPQPPDLSGFANDKCVDVVTPDGEACLVWGVAAIAKSKAAQDAAFAVQKQQQHRQRLMEWAAERSLTQARTRPVQHGLPPGWW